jgi:hypothetical protein
MRGLKMKRWNFVILGVVGALAITLFIARRQSSSAKPVKDESASTAKVESQRAPVLVELFTSEGCSSCPPADEVLARLEKEQPVAGAQIIALSQHVDYWNNLGWADPYSAAAFSERQGAYSDAFHEDGVYTPQMIVDGRAEFNGSHWEKALDEIATAARSQKASIQLARAESNSKADALQLNVRVENPPVATVNDSAEVLLAITEGNLRSSVARGENAGRNLNHTAVVRQLTVIGKIEPQGEKTFTAAPVINLARDWKRENLHAVVFLQEHGSRRVLGAASIALAAQ